MKTILALIGFTDATPEIVRVTGKLARALSARVYLIHIVDVRSDYLGSRDRLVKDLSREGIAREVRQLHRRIRLMAKLMSKTGIKATGLLVNGSPVRKALHELERLKPDLVIVGSHGRGRVYHLMPGHVGAAVASRARCPVMIVPAPRKTRST